jgi:ribosomal protein L1
MAKPDTEERVKVTVSLPRELVKAAKIAAIERDEDFQDLIAAGLRLVLGRKGSAR